MGVDAFVCCQSCFRTVVLPSPLYSSFGMFPPSACQTKYSCDLSNPQIRALFAAACEAGTISVFRDGLDKMAADINNSLYHEESLSNICRQIQKAEALRDLVRRP